ncbi:MAG: redoxin domain-containing protein [Chloroflexi bacterium]|nr:redoxin domain-containing protein [Chloroflexota bacterium]MCH8101927.1 redoxin domain-containing protein [Chloroflexota bacterium]
MASTGAFVAGISPDSPERHARFREENDLPFTLISDPDNKVARLYQARRRFGLGNRRITYVIDDNGMIADAFQHEITILRNVSHTLKALRTLQAPR